MKEKFICDKCGFIIKTSHNKHYQSCNGKGPRRKQSKKIGHRGGWNKGKKYEEIYDTEQYKRIINILSENGKKSKGVCLNIEDEENRRDKIRKSINKRYENGWLPKAGRTKKIEYTSNIAGKVLLDGTWELAVAKYLDINNIEWIRNTKRFKYYYDGKERYYTPDFLLIKTNEYLEIKGYTTEKDISKWKQFTEKLIIWKKSDLKDKKII